MRKMMRITKLLAAVLAPVAFAWTSSGAVAALPTASSGGDRPAAVGDDRALARDGCAVEQDDFRVLEGDFEVLRRRFNADRGKVRALFLASPTCGVCLRGVSELRQAMLESIDAEDLVVYVVWSSQLGAEERHVAAAMRLARDPRVLHFWDEEKLVGAAYQSLFDLQRPAWDYWILYGRETAWGKEGPPVPAWWEYQGPTGASRPEERHLEPRRFARKARSLLRR